MAYHKQEIINDIVIQCAGIPCNDCYIGITSDIEFRLREHNVSMSTDRWICRIVDSNELAREIRQYFIAAGMDGAENKGIEDDKIVYVYRKTSATCP